MNPITSITEQCGARWTVYATGASGARALWVLKSSGASLAKPHTVGFYAANIAAAAAALNN